VGRLGYGAGVAEYLQGLQVPLLPGAGVLADAVLAREPMVVAQGTGAMLVAPGATPATIPAASFIAQPLIVRGKAVGVLVAARKAGAPQVTPAELTIVQLFCNQAGLALDRTAA
jgi:GAF domain-containing protein